MIRITRNDDINFNVDEIHGKGDRYNITFYTVNNAVNIVKHDTDVHDGIIVLNGSELMTLGEGVMNLRVDNIAPNAGYNDGVYNSSFTKTTKYYIQAGIIVPDGSDTQTVIEVVGELQDALNGEITRSTEKDTAHDIAIANEATARANADSTLSDRITANTTAITNEATARANADSALSDRITTNATAIANTYNKQEVDDMLDDIDIVLPDNIVTDADYTHTDNNYTTAEKFKLSQIASGAEVNVQSDWAVTDSRKDAFIKNKPTKVSDFTNDAGYLTSYTETDPTVPAWAKAETKPTYTASEVGALPSNTTIPSKTSDLTNDSGFVSDSNYTHTDNNYTTTEKNKLAGLTNYDDTSLAGRVTANETALTNVYNKTEIDNKLTNLTTTQISVFDGIDNYVRLSAEYDSDFDCNTLLIHDLFSDNSAQFKLAPQGYALNLGTQQKSWATVPSAVNGVSTVELQPGFNLLSKGFYRATQTINFTLQFPNYSNMVCPVYYIFFPARAASSMKTADFTFDMSGIYVSVLWKDGSTPTIVSDIAADNALNILVILRLVSTNTILGETIKFK